MSNKTATGRNHTRCVLRFGWLLPAALVGLLTLCLTASMDLVVCQEDAGPGYLSMAMGHHCLEDQLEAAENPDGANSLSPQGHPEGCVEFHLALSDLGDNQDRKAIPTALAAAGFLLGAVPLSAPFQLPPTAPTTDPGESFSPPPLLQNLLSLATVVLRR